MAWGNNPSLRNTDTISSEASAAVAASVADLIIHIMEDIQTGNCIDCFLLMISSSSSL